jgi:dihydrofolate reductase
VRTVRIIEHVSLDGVIQAPGGPEEDTGGGFDWGGWAVPFHDAASGAAIDAAQGEGFDLLLGRRTYDIFAGYWPHQAGSMADRLNRARKHVATRRPESLGWGPAEGLGEDVAKGVRALRAREGPDLIVWGSSTLVPTLLHEGLADEVLLLVFPVLIGRGKRIFGGAAPPQGLAFLRGAISASGVQALTFRPAGPMRTGSFAGPPS